MRNDAAMKRAPGGSSTRRGQDAMLSAVTEVLDRQPSRSKSAGDLKHRILDSARTRIRRDGLYGCSLRDIAQDAGTSASNVVRLYGSKNQLLRAVYEQSYLTAMGWLEAIPAV